MSAVIVRWVSPHDVELIVDDRLVMTVSDRDENGGTDGVPSAAYAAQGAADAVARALGASVTKEKR